MFELGHAAGAGDVARVETLLCEGVEVNSRDSSGRTSLHWACESDHEDMQRVVDVLLDAGAEVNAQDEARQIPLHVAVQRISHQNKLENKAAGGENEETPLVISSKRNQVLVKTLLREGALVNVRDRDMRTALHCACTDRSVVLMFIQAKRGQTPTHVAMDNNLEIVKALLANITRDSSKERSSQHLVDHPQDEDKVRMVNSQDKDGNTALHLACKRSCLTDDVMQCVRLLLCEGAKVGVKNNDGMTALHMAARDSRADVVDILLNNGEDVNATGQWGNTPLHMASEKGRTETVRLLLSKGAKVGVQNNYGDTALHRAAYYGKADIVDILLNNGEDVNATDEYGNTPLHEASWQGQTETVLLLLSKGAKVGVKNNEEKTALHLAAHYSGADIVDILLNNGEDVNATKKYGNTPLHEASWQGQNETVLLLLSKGAKVGVKNNEEETALHLAAHYNGADIVDILLNNGEDINATKKYGNTPLHEASESGQTETVLLLVSKGAKVGVKNNKGMTALHLAARCKSRADIVDILLNYGEDVNATNNYGNTPLHEASEKGRTETVRLLLSKGARVGVKNARGQTPLHNAAAFATGDIVDVLVDQGEYVSAEDFHGNTPLHYLCEKVVLDNNPKWSLSHLSKAVFNINLLIIRGAKIDEQNILGENPHELVKGRRENRMKEVETTLITQAVRLKTLGLQDKFVISWILGQNFYDHVILQCCQELESMKSTMVVKDISLYQVLSHISQPFLVSTEDLQHIDEFLSSPDLLTRFPLYGATLRITFQRAKLLTLAVQSFYSEQRKQMMKKLPCEVAEQLVNFLSNKDLRMFIESE